ncbi:Uncharacterized protein FWK35_00006360 [Aphis craccivora]|uniref:THAP-type domain-containing protein n=1 Tax=Aphis craccivora TaxID=307492 RepID=A0A6G0YH74_APHCR|nr:Uncharacterized protein FWK35_00006360 [Aphis craccivora]
MTSHKICTNYQVKSLSKITNDNSSQKIRRQSKRIASTKNLISELQKQNLIDEEASYTLSESFGKKVLKKYSSTIRQFALSLHLFSAKAYSNVRQQFDNFVSQNVNAEPGFTEDSLKILTLKVKNSPHPILLSLSIDEMAITKHLVYMGTDMDNDISVYENWRLPIGYFVVDTLKTTYKKFCSSYLSAAQLLGCNYALSELDACFSSNCESYPKLIRNTFGEKKVLKDSANNEKKLNTSNAFVICKKRKYIIFLINYEDKNALTLCKENLKMKEFYDASATTQFIELFNIGFDIIHTRSINSIIFKKALGNENIYDFKLFTEKMTSKFVSRNQDHLELFFGSVRAHGGHNNNPTVKQFYSEYREFFFITIDIAPIHSMKKINKMFVHL